MHHAMGWHPGMVPTPPLASNHARDHEACKSEMRLVLHPELIPQKEFRSQGESWSMLKSLDIKGTPLTMLN